MATTGWNPQRCRLGYRDKTNTDRDLRALHKLLGRTVEDLDALAANVRPPVEETYPVLFTCEALGAGFVDDDEKTPHGVCQRVSRWSPSCG